MSVRFSKEAMEEYKKCVAYPPPSRYSLTTLFNGRHPQFGHISISSYKTAVITMKSFRPMFARVPMPNGDGMSKYEHLVLDVRTFQLVGSFGANQWDSPKDIETAEDMQLWVQGLRSGNGGGCVDRVHLSSLIPLTMEIATSSSSGNSTKSAPPPQTALPPRTPQALLPLTPSSSPTAAARPRPTRP